jgi:hypothetical protein
MLVLGSRLNFDFTLTQEFLALGKLDALSSLTVVVHDHPRWAMPDVNPSVDRLPASRANPQDSQ